MEFIKIIILSILLSICYGVIHDMVTANLCVEYFTIGHPKVIESESPFLLALVWGVIATWWAGLIIGIPLALTAQVGALPKINAQQIVRPMLVLLSIMGSLALLSGIIGFILAKTDSIHLISYWTNVIPVAKHNVFLAAGWAHGASYLSGFIGGIVLCIFIFRKRLKMKNL